MKKIIALILALTLSLLTLTSCGGVYSGIEKPNKPSDGGSEDKPTTPVDPDTPKDTEPFTVTLIYDDAPFVDTDGMYAIWTREGEIHNAPFIYDETTGISKASITGLDGDYAVTLSGVPTKYTYDSNAYSATNNKRNTVIELFRFYSNGTSSGADPYSAHAISRVGAYTAKITKKQPHMFYQFTPTREGTYTITTICDINANEINPSFDIYNGSYGSWYYNHTVDSGGAEGSYTRNVSYELSLHKENIGQPFLFKVSESSKVESDSIEVCFIVKYEAPDNSRDDHGIKNDKLTITSVDGHYVISSSNLVYADLLDGGVLYGEDMQPVTRLEGKMSLIKGGTELLRFTFTRTSTDTDEAAGGDLIGSVLVEEKNIDIGGGATYKYVVSAADGTVTLYNSVTKFYADEEILAERGEIIGPTGEIKYPEIFVEPGVYRFDGSMFGLNEEDGYYHLYNEESGKYDGPILYAKIRKENRFVPGHQPIGSPLPSEIAFIGGYSYVCKKCENKFSATECPKCGEAAVYLGVMGIEDPGNDMLHSLTGGTEDYYSFIASYAAYVNQETNSEGVYPVDEELKEFLQKVAIYGSYFMDGNGIVEKSAELLGYRLYSSEEDQWLFACCYYV